MGNITKEEARVIVKDYLVQKAKTKASTLEIRDSRPGDEAGIYNGYKIKNCYIVYIPDDSHLCVGASNMIAISKETGEIVMGGRFGD